MANKVKFGLSKCYYSKITISSGVVSYGTPVAMLGAVSMSLDPSGSSSNFAADNDANYYTSGGAIGYNGDLEMAVIDANFKKDILGYLADTNGVLYEPESPVTHKFALLFQFDGDAKNTRHVLYNCTSGRVPLNSATTAESKDPSTDTIEITASPASDTGITHAALEDDGSANYTGWYNTVYTVTA